MSKDNTPDRHRGGYSFATSQIRPPDPLQEYFDQEPSPSNRPQTEPFVIDDFTNKQTTISTVHTTVTQATQVDVIHKANKSPYLKTNNFI